MLPPKDRNEFYKSLHCAAIAFGASSQIAIDRIDQFVFGKVNWSEVLGFLPKASLMQGNKKKSFRRLLDKRGYKGFV